MSVELKRDIEVKGAYDVVVCGGGVSGVPAALAAAREGLSVLLVEAQAQTGGMATSGLVSHWLGGRTYDGRYWGVGGLFRSLTKQAVAAGAAILPRKAGERDGYCPFGWGKKGGILHAGVPLDPFRMTAFLDDKLAEGGVEVLFLARVTDVVMAGGPGKRISHVVISSKWGLTAVEAKVVVDATGDADVAAYGGCEVWKGRDEDNLMTPITLEFHVDNVDQDELESYIDGNKSTWPEEKHCYRFLGEIQDMMKDGTWPWEYNRLITVQLTERGTFMINTSRVCGVDGTDTRSLTDGIVRGRRETLGLMKVLRERIPGFERARLKAVASTPGVRETRRIKGEFVFTIDHLRGDTEIPGVIGFSHYGWDLPNPKEPSENPNVGEQRGVRVNQFPIPFMAMVPVGIDNLMCCGRSLSVERELLGPLREMAPCMAMGEAVGVAAGQVARDGAAAREVDTDRLREELKGYDAIVDVEQIRENPVQ